MDKIDIRDLRVGNWVSLHHPTMPPNNIRVSADWICTIEDINHGLIEEDSPLFRIVEPIPITPEILDKNAIIYDYDVADYGYIQVKGYQYREDDVLIDYCNGHIKITNDATNSEISMDICYVHQLQNILRDLCIYKEIII